MEIFTLSMRIINTKRENYSKFEKSIKQLLHLPSHTRIGVAGYERRVFVYNLNNKPLQMFIKEIVAVN